MKRLLCTILTFPLMLHLCAQQRDRIETDRPNESELAHLVTSKFMQVESGYYYEKTTGSEKRIHHPHTLLRYGLHRAVELRLLADFSTENDEGFTGKTFSGLEPIQIGMKFALLKERNGIPATSLLVHTGIPFLASRDLKAKHLSPEMRLLMENGITDKIEVTYNAGVEWDGIDAQPTWLYTFSPAIDITSHWDAFIEVFGRLKKNEAPEHSIDGGVEYFINDNFKLDICSGFGVSKPAPEFFVTFGGSIRFR